MTERNKLLPAIVSSRREMGNESLHDDFMTDIVDEIELARL